MGRVITLIVALLFCGAAIGQGVRLKGNIAGFGGAHFVGVPPGYTKLNVRYEFVAMLVDSGLHVPQYNGTPSGVRTGVWVGDGAIGVDTTNHRFYIYSGGAWVRVANYSEIPASYTFTNGLTESGGTVKLGGTLVDATTTINAGNNDVVIEDANEFSISSTGSGANYLALSSSASSRISRIKISPDSVLIQPQLGQLRIDTLNYTLSTTGKKIMLRDTATGLVQNIDPATMVRPLISLTTTGSSGAATYSNVTGVLNVPQYSGGGGSVNVADTLSWIDVQHYGARDDGKEVSDAAISSGTAILTSATASFSADDVGKYIRVGGAGAAGVELLTTIAGYTNSTTVTLTDNASTTVSSQRILWGTDNTSFIQSAINAAVSGENASGTVFFKKANTGRYLVADSNQATTSQLYIPTASYSPSATYHKSIRLLGMQTQTYFIDYVNGQKSPSTGIIIQSMRNDSAYSILGSGSAASAYGYHNWTMVYLENLTFRAVSLNGTTNIESLQSGIDFQLINMCDLRNVIVQTESDNFNSVRPDTSTFGIRLPYNNNGGYVRLDNVMIERFNSGIVASENVIGDNVWINACYNGWEFVTGTHPSFIKKSLVEWCVNGIMVSGANPNFNFGLYVIETYPTDISTKWFNTVYDFYINTGSPGSGNLNYYRVKGGTGVEMNGLTRNDAPTTSNYVFTKFNDSNPIEILRDSTNQFRVVSAANPSVLAKINSNNRTDVLFTKSNVSMYAIGQGDSTNTTENLHFYSYARSKHDMFINSSGNVQLGGTDARSTPQLVLRRSTGNANFGEGGDSAFSGAINIYRSTTGAASATGVGSAIHFVNPSATGQVHMTYRINGISTGSFTSDYTGNNSFVGTTSHTFYVGATGKQLINTNGVLITGDQIMHGTARKLYWTNSGTAADANWKTGYEVSPSNAQLVTGAAVVHDVYGGAANYGFMVRKTGSTSLFEIQGSDGKAYFGGNVGIGVASATAGLHLKTGTTAIAPLKITVTSAALLTTPLAGSIEVLVDTAYYTGNDATRKKIALVTDGNPFIASGTYTPTLTNVTNVSASTAYACQYMRVGNTVTVSGKIDIDITVSGAFEVGVSLPIASALTADEQCAGTAVGTNHTPTDADAMWIKADGTNDRAAFMGNDSGTTDHTHYFTFTYRII